MIIIRNIPKAIKIYGTLHLLTTYRKRIEDAKAAKDFVEERKNILEAEKTWSTALLKAFDSEITLTGKENLPKNGPVVFVGNHQGYADIVAYFSALSTVQFGYVAKDDLGKVPLYGSWIRRIRSVLIQRGDPKQALRAMETGINLINEGFSLMIFPEGTRSKGPIMGEFKRGSFKLATKPQVPIIPVSIDGSYKMYEETGIIQGAAIKIKVHPPIETKGLSKPEEKALAKKVENIVRSGVEELQQE
ncbi:MAG: lysophospholipid acyltransferase family protein [Anaerovoracaceae bacterium]